MIAITELDAPDAPFGFLLSGNTSGGKAQPKAQQVDRKFNIIFKEGLMSDDPNQPASAVAESRSPGEREKKPPGMPKWQERLLPLMSGLLIGLTVFFFAASFIQLVYLHGNISRTPQLNLVPVAGGDPAEQALSFDQLMRARQLDIESRLEANLIERRYHMASVVLMSSLWVRYLGFVTGMILALVGASFVLGKLREPVTDLEGKFSSIGLSLRSTSPGIILVVLGVALMLATIVDRDTGGVTDMPVYFSNSAAASSEIEPLPPSPLPTRANINTPVAVPTPLPLGSSP
jgi:hypothetical protein